MIEQIRLTFKKTLKLSDWMDSSTKKEAIKKVFISNNNQCF